MSSNPTEILLDRRFLLSGMASVLVAGCSQEPVRRSSQPSFYNNLAMAGARVDAPMAAEMISLYRRNNSRGMVVVDPILMRVAETQAAALAQADDVTPRSGPVGARLSAVGYPHRAAVETVSAGYLTLAEAFSGWRDSPPHRANMLNPAVTRLGIGTGFRPGSKYRVFWTLVLADSTRLG